MNLFLYLVGMLVFTSGFYFVKKSDRVWNGICSIFLSYIVWMIVQSYICGINISLQHRAIAWQYGILGIVFGACFWIKVWKEKQCQKYEYAWMDVVVTGLVLIAVAAWGKYQFGSALENFNFASLHDSARHMHFARQLTGNDFKTGEYASGQYFSAANTAVWMNAMAGILKKYDLYKVFICCELFVFLMNGMVFWMAIRRFLTNRLLSVVGIILTILYLFGHPCNSLVYGTSYLSTGIMLAILIYYVASLIIHQEISRIWGIVLLGFVEYGLISSYKMLLPIFLCGTLLYLYYYSRVKYKGMTCRKLYIACLIWAVLAVLGMICLTIFYTDLRRESDLVWEMYGHFYADYLFLLPFLILLLIRCWKKKNIGLEESLVFLNICFIIAMLIGVLNQYVSTYYFYKSYVTLWGLAFICVIKCFSIIESKEFPMTVFLSWMLLFAISVTGVDDYLYLKNEKLIKSESICLFPIYKANVSLLQKMEEKKELNKLIMDAAEKAYDEDVKIPYVSLHAIKSDWTGKGDKNLYIKYAVRYHVLAGQFCDWTTVFQEELSPEELREAEYPYVLVICDYCHPECIEEELQALKPVEVIKQTKYGCLLALQPD